jgi:homoserine kinase
MAEAVTAFAPGSASNLGPGFDCLGVALSGRGDRVTARLSPGTGVRVVSVSDPRIPLDATRNTAAIAANAVLRRAGSTTGLEISIEKGLPLAGGMGGSAASAVAGAVAADAAVGARLPREALMDAALEAEAVVAGRHADNVAPSLFGGLVLILGLDPPRLVFGHVHQNIAFVVSTPAYGVETKAARAVLPADIPRADGIAQAAHLGGLLLALERGDGTLIGHAMRDHIAHPHRASLYPGYVEARDAALAAGAYGVAVSGAGPTLLAIVPRGAQGAIAREVEGAYKRAGYSAESQAAEVDRVGARIVA